mgnify:CR=1 FL=1
MLGVRLAAANARTTRVAVRNRKALVILELYAESGRIVSGSIWDGAPTARRSYNVVYHDAVSTVELHHDLRHAIRDLCAAFPDSYWRELDAARAYPDAFVKALTDAGYLAALIPEAYGGSGLGIAEASIILEEINRSGGNAGACHAQMYTMGTLLRHGSDEQKREFLPKIAQRRAPAAGVRRDASRRPDPTRRS